MALGTVHASPFAELKLEPGNCPQFWFSFNGSCYSYVTHLMSWHHAEQNCYSEEARLVSIHSDEENDFVHTLIHHYNPPQTGTWIGLHDLFFEGGWMWSDGSDLKYTNWQSGYPAVSTSYNCA